MDMRGAVVAGWHRAVPSHYRPRADFFCKRGVPGSRQCTLSCDEIRQEWMDVAWLVRLANYAQAGRFWTCWFAGRRRMGLGIKYDSDLHHVIRKFYASINLYASCCNKMTHLRAGEMTQCRADGTDSFGIVDFLKFLRFYALDFTKQTLFTNIYSLPEQHYFRSFCWLLVISQRSSAE